METQITYDEAVQTYAYDNAKEALIKLVDEEQCKDVKTNLAYLNYHLWEVYNDLSAQLLFAKSHQAPDVTALNMLKVFIDETHPALIEPELDNNIKNILKNIESGFGKLSSTKLNECIYSAHAVASAVLFESGRLELLIFANKVFDAICV